MGKLLSYALEPGGPKRLTIDNNYAWKDSVAKLDGVEIGRIPDMKALQTGVDFTLPDGSILHFQQIRKLFFNVVAITRNGINLPGSQADPQLYVRSAYRMLYLIGGLSLFVGIISVFSETFQEIGGNWLSVLLGLIFLVLAFLTKRGSKTALIIGIILFGLDTISTIFTVSDYDVNPVSAFIARLIILVPLVMGIGAFNQIKKEQQVKPPEIK